MAGAKAWAFRLTPTGVRPSRRMAAIQASVSGSESAAGGIRKALSAHSLADMPTIRAKRSRDGWSRILAVTLGCNFDKAWTAGARGLLLKLKPSIVAGMPSVTLWLLF